MPRIPFPTVDDLPDGHKDILEKIQQSRGRVPDLFRILAYSAPVLEKREKYGKALREETILDPKLRELAIMLIAHLNGGGYEFTAHAKIGKEAGVAQEKIDAVPDYETSPVFNEAEKAVMQYAYEVTENIKVIDATWKACEKFLNRREMIELVLQCAWYNQTSRITWPLQMDHG